ncbi:hypothetical protein VB713_05765 [Anabaena cylindrica UHCC 0172]|uniref:nSTAND1 domain-containing NTPase n=1 Tax=Anabaena cylindrica TaxID=1165 RepID=UPI002B1FDE73|nr:hypothetical protein [Anabaena cylindrica]MEA5550488.1 hypothetical protein [Anabaena cylindrica UHCC 0172]
MSEQGKIQQRVTGAEIAATSATGDATITITNYYYWEEARLVSSDSTDAVDKNIPCPYRGLFHFGPNDADVFFGRETFIEKLYSATKTNNFIHVLGASGSGKSSVVLAGLVPKLQKEGHWQFTHFRPGSDPFHALALALVSLYTPRLDQTEQIAQARKLANYLQDGSVLLSDVFITIRQNHPNHRVLLIADQFEEIYTLCNNQEIRCKFLDCLLVSLETATSLSSSATVLVTTMRADFLGNALSYRPFADVLQNADVKLGAMNREELTEVIEKPAQKVGITFDTGLVKRILKDVEDQPGNLPLLEFALTQLWNKRTGKHLSHKIYEEIGEVEGALARHADEKYGNLTNKDKEKVRRIFIQLVLPGEGTEDTKRLATRAEVGEENWDLVTRLANERLVVSNTKDRIDTVEIVHEALIRAWSNLQGWIEDNRAFRVWQERLKAAMRQWEFIDNDDSALLRGVALSEAESWLQQRLEEISSSERVFIKTSAELRDHLQQQEEERQQRELQQERKARQAAQVTAGFTIASLIVIVVSGSFAWWQRQQSVQIIENVSINSDVSTPELLTNLPEFLKIADQRVQSGDVDKAIAYYRKILTESNKLLNQVKANSISLTSENQQKLQEISQKSQKSLGEVIQKFRLPQLEAQLKQGQFGKLKDDQNLKYTDFEEQYTEGALRTSYAILLRRFGVAADLNNSGLIENKDEAERMPCEIIKAIEEMWRRSTANRCGWYGSQSYYEEPVCRELGGKTLINLVFVYPYNIPIDRINSCHVAPIPATTTP